MAKRSPNDPHPAYMFGIQHKEAFAGLLASSSPDPVCIVNFVKFLDKANYDPAREEARLGLSGREAYQKYVSVAETILPERGASFLLFAHSPSYLVGDGDWDLIWINEYPNVGTLAATVADPRLTSQLYHRDAGVACQHNIVATPRRPAR